MQNPVPPDVWFCAHDAGSESLHVYAPLITTGVVPAG